MQRQRRLPLVDEAGMHRAARERLEPERAGAGEEVEDAGALRRRRVAVAPVGEEVEEASRMRSEVGRSCAAGSPAPRSARARPRWVPPMIRIRRAP